MNGSNGMNGSMSTNGATAKGDAMGTVPAVTPKFTDSLEQAAVIQAPSYEDVVVVAGAGSGKTYTMTRRIITLIDQGISPEKILGLTFTRKAASELLSRVSAAVTRNQAGRGTRVAFLKPEVSTYDAFFQTIVRQYGLLVGFDQNTQPLSEAGALQLIHTVLDKHMDQLMAFDQGGDELGKFSTIAGNVFTLSNAIAGAMIGSDCTSFDEAVERVRAWDKAFVAQVAKALEDEDVPDDEPKVGKAPKQKKKESDTAFETRMREYRAQCHQLCVYKTAQLAGTARKRDLLLDLVADYHAEKRALNMAEFSDFTIAAFQLVTRFPSIGATYRKRYTHVLLDEYQDTSTTQAALLTALFHADSTHRSAVNAVGDPFQSIYAWRGASPGAFRMLQHDFGHDATDKPYTLTVTRRNSRMVLEAANNLTKPLRLPARRRGSSLMREVDVPPLANIDNAPEGTLGVLGYATFGQEIDAIVRFAKRKRARRRSQRQPSARGAPVPLQNADASLRGRTGTSRPHHTRRRPGRTPGTSRNQRHPRPAARRMRPHRQRRAHAAARHATIRPVRRRSAGARRHRRTAQHRATLPRARVGRHRGGGCESVRRRHPRHRARLPRPSTQRRLPDRRAAARRSAAPRRRRIEPYGSRERHPRRSRHPTGAAHGRPSVAGSGTHGHHRARTGHRPAARRTDAASGCRQSCHIACRFVTRRDAVSGGHLLAGNRRAGHAKPARVHLVGGFAA